MEITFDPVTRIQDLAKHDGWDFAVLDEGVFYGSMVFPAKAGR